jgi:hypothetical protein
MKRIQVLLIIALLFSACAPTAPPAPAPPTQAMQGPAPAPATATPAPALISLEYTIRYPEFLPTDFQSLENLLPPGTKCIEIPEQEIIQPQIYFDLKIANPLPLASFWAFTVLPAEGNQSMITSIQITKNGEAHYIVVVGKNGIARLVSA